jgi:SAM-dependent methyltransferase
MSMHLNNYANRTDLLIDWILQTLPKNAAVLDVGANDGSFCPEVRRVAQGAAVFAGVDPDMAKLDRHPFLTQRYRGLFENSKIPDETFDCVYAIYVLEHVQDAEGFVATAARVLRPGGSFFFITPNGLHYFAAIAGTLAKLNLQEKVLRAIRPGELVGRYHYPALYRLNHPAKLEHMGRRYGFSAFEFRYSESFHEFACYFPGPLKVFPWLWERVVEQTRTERLLGNLMGRMVKRPA